MEPDIYIGFSPALHLQSSNQINKTTNLGQKNLKLVLFDRLTQFNLWRYINIKFSGICVQNPNRNYTQYKKTWSKSDNFKIF